MTDAAIISGSLVDVRNVGTHKSIKLTIHIPEEHATRVVAAFGWPTGVNPIAVAIARLTDPEPQRASSVAESPRPDHPGIPAGADAPERRKFASLPYAQQAALRCNDPIYWAFLREMCGLAGSRVHGAETAKFAIYEICQVGTRANIAPDTEAETHWLELEKWFDAWKVKDRVMA